ncbi:unnamed protein product [Effrenium voratum]|nr:unnamed protein product [Effrenium voratum]
MTSLTEACSVSVFVTMASTVASSVDCEFERTNNLLEIMAALFLRADDAELKSKQLKDPPSWDEINKCTVNNCHSCQEQRYFTYNGKKVLVLPQPSKTGRYFTYQANEPRVMTPNEVPRVEKDMVQRGLRFAGLAAGLYDYKQTEKVLFTPHLHMRLQYFGNDPAVVMNLWGLDADNASDGCEGGPNPRNVIPAKLYSEVFNTSKTHTSKEPERQIYWTTSHESRKTGYLTSEASAVAYKATMQGEEKVYEPMGTVTMTVNMSYAGEALGGIPLSPNDYAIITDKSGSIIMMTPQARKVVFHEGMTEAKIQNPENQMPCKEYVIPPDNCWWDAPPPLTLLHAQKEAEQYSGIDFSRMLGRVFTDTPLEKQLCSAGVRTTTFTVPKCHCKDLDLAANCTCEHLAVFCRLIAFPDWSIVVFAPVEELQSAAQYTVDKENITKTNINSKDAKDGKEGNIYEDNITLTNTGRVPLPFDVAVSAADGDNASCITVDPQNGTLEPGAQAVLTLKFDLDKFGTGTSSGWVLVQPDLVDGLGACFRNRAGTRFHFTRPKKPSFLWRTMQRNGIPLSVAVMLVATMILYRVVSSWLSSYYGNLSKERSTIDKALAATQELSFPMVLLPVAIFRKHKRFVAFEDTLNESLWLHTIQDIDNFLNKELKGKPGKKNKVIFMSHQWTAFAEPDHTGEQYKGMVEAVDTVIKNNGWDEEDTYVWLDYSSIPQRHRPSQTAAINSLTVYAAKVSTFVVVAPKVDHCNLEGVICDEESYKMRAWCRAEQLSHLLAQAGDNMFLAKKNETSGVPDIIRLNDNKEWLEQSIEVFKGQLTCCRRKHEGMDMCDRERLVVPMLGLWAQLCRTVQNSATTSQGPKEAERPFADLQEIHEHLCGRIKEVFPETFTYETEAGSEERSLFGKLVERLEERLSHEAKEPTPKEDNKWARLRIAARIATKKPVAKLPEAGGRRLSQALTGRGLSPKPDQLVKLHARLEEALTVLQEGQKMYAMQQKQMDENQQIIERLCQGPQAGSPKSQAPATRIPVTVTRQEKSRPKSRGEEEKARAGREEEKAQEREEKAGDRQKEEKSAEDLMGDDINEFLGMDTGEAEQVLAALQAMLAEKEQLHQQLLSEQAEAERRLKALREMGAAE